MKGVDMHIFFCVEYWEGFHLFYSYIEPVFLTTWGVVSCCEKYSYT